MSRWIVVGTALFVACAASPPAPAASEPDAAGATAADAAADASDGDGSATAATADATVAPLAEDFAEAWQQGVADHLGQAKIATETTEAGVSTFEFDVKSGPICLRGDPFRMAIRDAKSDDLLIFLQGGGACWSTFCLAIQKAPAGIPKLDVLDPNRESNPFKAWNIVYLPYCDGSMFAGDADTDDDKDGKLDRQQHGLQNLSAALDVAIAHFPKPARIVLAGSSGGGFGTIPAVLLVRKLWPKAEILLVQDSGTGTGKTGDPAFLQNLVKEFHVERFLPASCLDCKTSPHLTPLLAWELARDAHLRVAAFSSYRDSIMADVFLKIAPELFKVGLLEATTPLHAAFPTRYKRFFIDDTMHTTMLGDASGLVGKDLTAVTLPPDALVALGGLVLGSIDTTKLGEVTVAQWLAAARDGTAAWQDLLAP